MSENKMLYKRPYKPAKIVYNWKLHLGEELFKTHLITSEKELFEILKNHYTDKLVALDTETNSLDIGYGNIVGMSFAFDEKEGYYIPLNHTDTTKNLDIKKVSKIWNNFLTEDKVTLMFNESFDISFLEKIGIDFQNRKVFDVQNLVWLKDTNKLMPSLKESEEFYLGWIVPTYEETTEGRNFEELTPEEAYHYASIDTLSLFALYKRLLPDIAKECPHILKLDNQISKTLTYLNRTPLNLRKEILPDIINYYTEKKKIHEQAFFDVLGYPINIRSTKQLREALIKMGINTMQYTDKGAMSVKAEALQSMVKTFPILQDVIEYNSLASLESGCVKYLNMPDTIRGKYKDKATPHGRLASGGDNVKLPKGVEPFFAKVNMQNFPVAPEETFYKPVKAKSEWNIEGYNFEEVDSSYEGTKLSLASYKGNIRRILHSPSPDWYFVNCDYGNAELRLAGILSKEPNLLVPFKQGVDLHRYVAEQMYGKENYTKQKRKNGKIMNFLSLYGGSPQAVQANMNYEISYEEAEDLFNTYWKTMTTLKQWINIQCNKAKANPNVKTYFGRPRRLHFYLYHEYYSMRSFGERSVISQIVAGTLGDIIRMKLVKCYNELFNHPDYKDDIQFYMCVHDSLEILVKRERMQEILTKFRDIMYISEKDYGWAIPIPVDLEIGFSHGFSVPVKQNEEGIWKLDF